VWYKHVGVSCFALWYVFKEKGNKIFL